MKLRYVLFLFIMLSGCTSTSKYSPEAAIRKYFQAADKNDLATCYDLISTKSKETANYNDYCKVYQRKDFVLLKSINIDTITEISSDKFNADYHRYKLAASYLLNGKPTKTTMYCTMVKENQQWKKVWDKTLLIAADEKFGLRDFVSAFKLYSKVAELDPYEGYAYEKLGWCYAQINDASQPGTKNQVKKYYNQALDAEPYAVSHYIAMAGYYDLTNNYVQVNTLLLLGLMHADNAQDSLAVYDDLGMYAFANKDYADAKGYFVNAIKIDSSDNYARTNLEQLYQIDYP